MKKDFWNAVEVGKKFGKSKADVTILQHNNNNGNTKEMELQVYKGKKLSVC